MRTVLVRAKDLEIVVPRAKRDDDEVVKKGQEHARTIHGMELSRDQALAMARPA